MPPYQLTASDQQLLGDMVGFTERHASNGVYCNFTHSVSRGNLPVAFVVALGDQALALQKLLMSAAVPESGIVEPEGKSNGW